MSATATSADHRVHGMGTEMEAPTWPAITAGEAEAVIARFASAGRMVALRWHSPRPFSAATLVDTTRGAFFLKRHHHKLRSIDGLAEEHAFIAHLRAAGTPVPEVMLAADGMSAIAVGDWTYELHRKGQGVDRYRDRLSWTPFLSHSHARAAGAALARLHCASAGFAASVRKPRPLVASFTILPATDPMAAAEAYVAARPALAGFLTDRAWQSDLARLFAASGDGLPAALAGHASLWTQNDWHPSNSLWADDGTVATAFDFGLADRTCAVHDIATAIERTCVRWLDLRQDAAIGDARAALDLLTGYVTVLPLSRTDIATIVRLLPLVHVEFALSEVDYFSGVVADPVSAALAWDDYLIGHADWFITAPGQSFLRQIGDGAIGQ